MSKIFEDKYTLFKEIMKKEIDSKYWKCIYGVWMLNHRINYSYYKEQDIKIMKHLLKDLFDEYPIEDFITLINIYQEYVLVKDKIKESEE